MKLNRKTITIAIAALTVAGTGIWVLANRAKKKRLYEELMNDLATGTKSGDATNTGALTVTGGAMNPNTFQNTPGASLQTFAAVQDQIKQINGWIHGFLGRSNEQALIDYFTKIGSKTKVSQVAYEYEKKYGIALAEDIKYIDYTPGGISLGTNFDVPKIVDIVNKLPLK